MADRQKFALTDKEHQKIFEKLVVPVYFSDIGKHPDEPSAVILGGQPGAGKSALLDRATADLEATGSTVVINGDDFRIFHPAYARLQQDDPENAAYFTDHDSGRWVEKTIEHGKTLGVNLVIESTMRNPDTFEKTSENLRKSGYMVEARAMAVPAAESWQGVHMRYEEMLARGEQGRFTKREAHDAGYEGVPRTLEAIEKNAWADRVTLENRSGAIIYENHRKDGQWANEPGARSALEAERTRPRSVEEADQYAQRWKLVAQQQEARGLSAQERQAIQDQAPRLPQTVPVRFSSTRQNDAPYWAQQIPKKRHHREDLSETLNVNSAQRKNKGPTLK